MSRGANGGSHVLGREVSQKRPLPTARRNRAQRREPPRTRPPRTTKRGPDSFKLQRQAERIGRTRTSLPLPFSGGLKRFDAVFNAQGWAGFISRLRHGQEEKKRAGGPAAKGASDKRRCGRRGTLPGTRWRFRREVKRGRSSGFPRPALSVKADPRKGTASRSAGPAGRRRSTSSQRA